MIAWISEHSKVAKPTKLQGGVYYNDFSEGYRWLRCVGPMDNYSCHWNGGRSIRLLPIISKAGLLAMNASVKVKQSLRSDYFCFWCIPLNKQKSAFFYNSLIFNDRDLCVNLWIFPIHWAQQVLSEVISCNMLIDQPQFEQAHLLKFYIHWVVFWGEKLPYWV